MTMKPLHLLLGTALLAGVLSTPAQAASITVQTDRPGAAPTQFGIFFEDINYAGDGGLYPERIKNRSFEFKEPLMGWKQIARGGATATASVLDEKPLNASNQHYLRLASESTSGTAGLANEGFFGVGVQKGAEFTFSLYARSITATPPAVLVEIEGADGRKLGGAKLAGFTRDWQRHSVKLRATGTDATARVNLLLSGRGALDLDMVSLFPRDNWGTRPNGLRADLVRMLAELKPAFMRFPGGCIVEGHTLPDRYQWKTTIGDLAARKLIINRWNDEFKHRPAPDYFQSFGLGFFEYFQLCEDIGAAPLPILNCGMACQFNSGELAPLDQLDPYIQDALDLIEFANGPADSTWGRQRAAMGHRAPFKMTMLGVGNEQWGPQYVERYAAFAKVLKARHPEIKLVTSAGPDPDGEKFNFLWPRLRELGADIVDEHYYRPPMWFLDNTTRYDHYPRTGPKVFGGEYAAQSVRTVSPENRNNWECAIAEAAMMTGLERNSDVVTLASYAPLLAHVEGWQWTPDLIWFDNLRAYGTPNYFVQQLFCANRGDAVLPTTVASAPLAPNGQPRLFASASYERKSKEVILKVVNATPTALETDIRLPGGGTVQRQARVVVLASTSLKAENSLDQPRQIAPQTTAIKNAGAEFKQTFPASSVTVLRMRVEH